MTRPGGPGGMDLNAMMKQVQQMQSEMMEAQEKLQHEVVDASAGGGMVKVKMSGDLRLLEIAIDPEAIDPDEPEPRKLEVSSRGVARPAGVEPATFGFGNQHSIQLSYGRAGKAAAILPQSSALFAPPEARGYNSPLFPPPVTKVES